jgi:hypothetical protein
MKQKKQEGFKRSPSGEPINPGPSFSQFVEIVAGMGERAAIHGTVIRRLRQDKDKDKSTDE